MKHILNNLTEQEKNAIREQHTGGMKVMTDKFKQLLETKQGDVKPYLNEDVASSFKMGLSGVKDPMVKKVLTDILDCAKAMVNPLKVVDFLRAVGNFVVLFLGEPSESSDEAFERYNIERDEIEKNFLKLINPCKNVTMEEIKSVMDNKEFQKFFMDLKKKFQ